MKELCVNDTSIIIRDPKPQWEIKKHLRNLEEVYTKLRGIKRIILQPQMLLRRKETKRLLLEKSVWINGMDSSVGPNQ